jgi:hypothetical protein
MVTRGELRESTRPWCGVNWKQQTGSGELDIAAEGNALVSKA